MKEYKKVWSMLALAGILVGCTPEATEDQEETTTQKVESGWYMRATVEVTTENEKHYAHNSAGVFGALVECEDDKDRHDVEAAGPATIQVRLVNKSLNDEKEYFSDYRHYDANAEENAKWDFVVVNSSDVNLTGEKFTLGVEKLKNLYAKKSQYGYDEVVAKDQEKRASLSLVDLDEDEVYAYEDAVATKFEMNEAHVRHFRWVLGEVTEEKKTETQLATMSEMSIASKATQSHDDAPQFGTPPAL